MNNQRTTSPLKVYLDAIQIHPLHKTHFGQYQAWSADWKMGTAISCIECSQMPGLNEKEVEKPFESTVSCLQQGFIYFLFHCYRVEGLDIVALQLCLLRYCAKLWAHHPSVKNLCSANLHKRPQHVYASVAKELIQDKLIWNSLCHLIKYS